MAMSTGDANENLTVYRLRWIGYGLLVFALVDVIQILTSFQPNQPTWVPVAIGQVVERSVVPLLGFTFVFFGEYYGRKSVEKVGLRILSWLCLVLAIAFLLMIPPMLLGAFNVSAQTQQQVGQQVDQRLTQLQQLEEQLNKSNPEQIKALATQLNSAGVNVDPNNPDAVKTQIRERIKTIRDELKKQADNPANNQASANLIKNAIKWSIGAVVTAVLFFYLWRSSRWG